MCPRTFLTVQEFLWYNFSAVSGSSAQWLYGGANGDLLQEGLCYMLHDPGLLQLLTHVSAGDTQTVQGRSASVSAGSPGVHKVLFEPSEHPWQV